MEFDFVARDEMILFLLELSLNAHVTSVGIWCLREASVSDEMEPNNAL